jgi:hypothetical protein
MARLAQYKEKLLNEFEQKTDNGLLEVLSKD